MKEDEIKKENSNRPIRFRAWNGMEMEYNVTVGKFGTFYVNPGDKGDGLDPNDSASLTPNTTKYHNDTPVMQYTGMNDRNGKDIYESDIVKAFIGGEPYGTGKVIFHNGIFWIEWIDDKEADMEPLGCLARPFGRTREPVEVIGNAYHQNFDKNQLKTTKRRNEPMKPENKAEVKTPQEFYTEKAVYHVDGYEYNVDEPELVKAFHLFAQQQIGVYKSDLVKRIEELKSQEEEVIANPEKYHYNDVRQANLITSVINNVLSIITKEQ